MNVHIRKYISKLGAGLAEDQWSTPINMTECFKYLGYDVMSEFTFGQSFQLQDNEDKRFVPESVILSGKIMGAYLQFPDLEKANLHLLFARQAAASRKLWMNLTSQVVRDRVAKGKEAQHDLFSFVVDAKDPETGKGFSMDELFDEARLLLVGGSDTSSTTLAALMFYLSRYPLCYEKLTTEIRSTFQSADDIQSGPTMNRCTYLRACIEEALRMSPPIASSLWREVSPGTGGLNIDGLYVPEGTEVGVSSYVIHHNEEYFPDSFTFNPERWIVTASNPKEKVDLAKRAFSPFSLGSRGCPGRVMAYMEISNVLAQTIWYFDFAAPEGKMKQIGEGRPDGPKERRRKLEFQLQDHLISSHDGPYLRFKLRQEVITGGNAP
jgi:cytochrome P450